MEALTTKKVKILGHDYEIERESTIKIGNPGECGFFVNTIRVANDLPDSSQTEILLHEIIEAILARNDIEIDHHIIAFLSESLHQVLRDNKLRFYESQK